MVSLDDRGQRGQEWLAGLGAKRLECLAQKPTLRFIPFILWSMLACKLSLCIHTLRTVFCKIAGASRPSTAVLLFVLFCLFVNIRTLGTHSDRSGPFPLYQKYMTFSSNPVFFFLKSEFISRNGLWSMKWREMVESFEHWFLLQRVRILKGAGGFCFCFFFLCVSRANI